MDTTTRTLGFTRKNGEWQIQPKILTLLPTPHVPHRFSPQQSLSFSCVATVFSLSLSDFLLFSFQAVSVPRDSWKNSPDGIGAGEGKTAVAQAQGWCKGRREKYLSSYCQLHCILKQWPWRRCQYSWAYQTSNCLLLFISTVFRETWLFCAVFFPNEIEQNYSQRIFFIFVYF